VEDRRASGVAVAGGGIAGSSSLGGHNAHGLLQLAGGRPTTLMALGSSQQPQQVQVQQADECGMRRTRAAAVHPAPVPPLPPLPSRRPQPLITATAAQSGRPQRRAAAMAAVSAIAAAAGELLEPADFDRDGHYHDGQGGSRGERGGTRSARADEGEGTGPAAPLRRSTRHAAPLSPYSPPAPASASRRSMGGQTLPLLLPLAGGGAPASAAGSGAAAERLPPLSQSQNGTRRAAAARSQGGAGQEMSPSQPLLVEQPGGAASVSGLRASTMFGDLAAGAAGPGGGGGLQLLHGGGAVPRTGDGVRPSQQDVHDAYGTLDWERYGVKWTTGYATRHAAGVVWDLIGRFFVF
jgi:hypothetical protein